MKRSWSWTILLSLLGALVLGALTAHRLDWPDPLPTETTWAMQAESLARDFDLRYTREDYDRFVARWGRSPEGLELVSGDGGKTLGFDRALPYALAVAPFSRWDPLRGPITANALFLLLAAVASALALERRLGDSAPLWIAVAVFASVTFGFVFRVEPWIFCLAVIAIAFSLIFGREHRSPSELTDVYDVEVREPEKRFWVRWMVVGGLLALPALEHPLYLLLLLPAAAGVPELRRREGLVGLAVGAVLVASLFLVVGWRAAGVWSPVVLERLEATSRTGFPEVDFPQADWSEAVERQEADRARLGVDTGWRLDWRLWAWNGLYLLGGRNLGLLPYFLPALFAFLVGGRHPGRVVLGQAVVLTTLLLCLVYPFGFAGELPSPGNALFLPLFGALWFLPARRARLAGLVAVVVVAAPFLWPLWTAPRLSPVSQEGRPAHVGAVAERLLPLEITQETLPGIRAFSHERAWIVLVDRSLRPAAGGRCFEIEPGARASFYLAKKEPVDSVLLELSGLERTEVRLEGGEAGEVTLWPDGRVGYELRLARYRSSHSTWWSRERHYFYRLTVVPSPKEPSPVSLRIRQVAP